MDDDFVIDACTICDRVEQLVEVAVFPDWMIDVMIDVLDHRGVEIINPYDERYVELCLGCANGLEEHLEKPFAEIAGPLIEGHSTSLDPAAQELTARWILKAEMMKILADEWESPDRMLETAESVLRRLKAGKAPVQDFSVRIGGFDVTSPVEGTAAVDHLLPKGVRTPPERSVACDLSAGLLWELVILPLRMRGLDGFRAAVADNRDLISIWPAQSTAVSWPGALISGAEVLALHEAWTRERTGGA
ncbi:hypothetical protein GIS00_14475 [Nakamurella sp. YIM 132087]|uniref:Uncharacterized protein n=1 Tax=Nakamurella alba TaxID=2665158 RepID=A0A7K1FM19_9ACTN|nr:hypothetical protein [Nakamurella alba]MTD15146.1 hypothetical protein [Nakamurella alba]